MKWIVPILFMAITLPFMFNACGGFHSSNTDYKTLAFGCKRMLEGGHATAVRAADHTSVFASRKVVLNPNDARSVVREQGSTMIPAGSELSVVLDNACVVKENPVSDFVAAVMKGKSPHPALATQAYTYVVPAAISQFALENQTKADSCVIGVSWNHKYQTQQASVDSYQLNDPMMSQQTHLSAMRAPIAYSLFYGGSYGMPVNGGIPVRIAVLDTGIDYNHTDLQENIFSFAEGWGVDVTNNSFDPMDVSPIGHGTHLSGILAAVSNNNVGIVGTMPFNGKVMAIKIFESDGQGGVQTSTTDFSNGMQVAMLNGADVINLSIDTSTTDYDAIAEEQIDQAIAQGIVVVVAIGNGNPNGQLVDGTNVHVIPAQLSTKRGVIGVASYDGSTGNISSFSNYSTTYAEIAAPGENSAGVGIFSTLPSNQSSYGQLAGTSQAAPMVAAAAALTIGWIRDSYGMSPTPAEVERLITSSSATNPKLAGYVRNGNQLDLYNLALAIQQQYPGTNGGPKTIPVGITCY